MVTSTFLEWGEKGQECGGEERSREEIMHVDKPVLRQQLQWEPLPFAQFLQ